MLLYYTQWLLCKTQIKLDFSSLCFYVNNVQKKLLCLQRLLNKCLYIN